MEELNAHLQREADAKRAEMGEEPSQEVDTPYFANEDEDDLSGPSSDIVDSVGEFGFDIERDEDTL